MSLHPGVQIGTGNCNVGGNPVMGDGLASHPGGVGGGGRNILRAISHLACMQTSPLPTKMHKMYCNGADDDI